MPPTGQVNNLPLQDVVVQDLTNMIHLCIITILIIWLRTKLGWRRAMAEETYQPGSMPEIFQLVELASRKLTQIQRDTIRTAGLTPPQYFVLSLLWEQDDRTFKELAAAASCSPATMTGIVDTLEGKGLVRREPNPHDRRSLLARLTPEGQAMQNSTPSLEGIFACCCAGLNADEARELSRLLRRLVDSLG